MASPFNVTKTPSRPRSHKLDPASIYEFVEDLIGDDLHAQRVWSVANGVVGVLHAATLAIHAIGEGLSVAMGLEPKHAIKQVDRLLSNRGVDVEMLAPLWVSFVLAERKDIVVALDWTDFDGDAQTTLVLSVITTHGRATPLLWKTVAKKGLKTRRNDYEDDLLRRLREAVPEDVRVTVLADRGFGDQKLYQFRNRSTSPVLLGAHRRVASSRRWHFDLPRHRRVRPIHRPSSGGVSASSRGSAAA